MARQRKPPQNMERRLVWVQVGILRDARVCDRCFLKPKMMK